VRALFYPVMGLAALAIVLGVATLAVLAFRNWRKQRAVGAARWESYAVDAPGGMTEVGIQLVARWGRHQLLLHRNAPATTVPAGDLQGLFAAQFDANAHADANNSMRVSVRNRLHGKEE